MALRAPEEIRPLLRELHGTWQRRGLDRGAEALAVLRAAEQFLGWDYRITREQVHGLIDCSSLVSQSSWHGAAVGTPFVAETQRTAYSARDVGSDSGDWLPGDALIRHRSRAESPGGRHNHVALFAGWDAQGRPWMLESRETGGVRAAVVDDAAAEGGARRFLPNPTTAFADAAGALLLARGVPKLGRLGARLTSGLLTPRRHHGIDVYFAAPVAVIAPIGGTLAPRRSRADPLRWDGILIASGDGSEVVALSGLELDAERRAGAEVSPGEPLGLLAGAPRSGCNSLPRLRRLPMLHVEYWSARATGFCEERGLSLEDLGELRAFNPLYAIKLGLIRPPVAPADAAATVRLPLR